MKNIKIVRIIWIFILLLCDFSAVLAQFTQTGMASYYAGDFHGKRTACGERYNMNELTAAHPSLPFHTKVKVTNLSNKKSVIVRINDRGPHTKKRVIDLSKAAAKKIGLIQAGVTKVKIEVIEPNQEEQIAQKQERVEITPTQAKDIDLDNKGKNPQKETAIQKTKFTLNTGKHYNENGNEVFPKGFGIQIISLTDIEKLTEQVSELKPKFKNIFIESVDIKGKPTYRIMIGEYTSKSLAKKDITKLKKLGYKGFAKKYQLK
jgi:rare lipoprotein A